MCVFVLINITRYVFKERFIPSLAGQLRTVSHITACMLTMPNGLCVLDVVYNCMHICGHTLITMPTADGVVFNFPHLSGVISTTYYNALGNTNCTSYVYYRQTPDITKNTNVRY